MKKIAELNTPGEKRLPCCRLLRKLSQDFSPLADPQAVHEAMALISSHCELMKRFGQSPVKWDLAKSECYLAVSPAEAQSVIDEFGKTIAVNTALESDNTLMAFFNSILANNAHLKQIDEKFPFFLSELREGEKRFGCVPETSLLKDENRPAHALGAGDALKSHPLLAEKPQFDGMPPKSNPDPKQNPEESAKNAEELQYQLQLKLQNQQKYTPSAAPAIKPRPV